MNFEKTSPCHRTTVAHFLNHGKWDHKQLEDIIKAAVMRTIYNESCRTGKPIFCVVDDTITSKTKPSSQALNPIENAYFHQSHLKRRQDYGHQAVSVMLACNGIELNYAVIMYDKSKSKIQIVCDIAEELQAAPNISYLLCDSWYTCDAIMNAFLKKGFYTVGALKTNRVIYPVGIKQKVSEFALYMRSSDKDVHLVTVGTRKYYVKRYEGKLNGIENAVVLISYPEGAFGDPKALRAFICTDVSLKTEEILAYYVERWPVEVFFRQTKGKLALGGYQIRTSQGIQRYWLLMSLAHLVCCLGTGKYLPFEEGYSLIQKEVRESVYIYVYKCAQNGLSLETTLARVS